MNLVALIEQGNANPLFLLGAALVLGALLASKLQCREVDIFGWCCGGIIPTTDGAKTIRRALARTFLRHRLWG